MENYNNNTNVNNNWLFMGVYEWTISPDASGSNSPFVVFGDGRLFNFGVELILGVRPVFYLNSNVTYAGGTGTETDPYRVN